MSRGLAVIQRKIDRARRDLDELTAELAAYDAREGTYRCEVDPDFGHAIFHLLEQPDPEWEITVGAITHQLRSALDQLVTLAVVAAGGAAENHRGQFPITESPREYHRVGKDGLSYRDRSLLGVPEEAKRVIDGVQPFGDPQHPVALLQHMSNWEKHRDGQASFATGRGSFLLLRSELQQEVQVFYDPGPGPRALHDGDDLLAAVPPKQLGKIRRQLRELRRREPEAAVEGVFRIGICFGRRGVFTFQIRQVIEFIEGRVVTPLAPYVTHKPS